MVIFCKFVRTLSNRKKIKDCLLALNYSTAVYYMYHNRDNVSNDMYICIDLLSGTSDKNFITMFMMYLFGTQYKLGKYLLVLCTKYHLMFTQELHWMYTVFTMAKM